MKKYIWICSITVAGLLSGCGNSDDQRSLSPEAYAAQKVTAMQRVMDQAISARNAVEAADSNRELAIAYALAKSAAVQETITKVANETALLKKNAASKARWAALTHDRADAARATLLQAALEQDMAEKLVAEKAKAVQAARIQLEIHTGIAGKALQEKRVAEKLAARVIAAERLATLSIQHAPQTKSATTTAGTAADMQTDAPKHAKKENHPVVRKTVPHRPVAHHNIRTFEQHQKAKVGPNLFAIIGQSAGKSPGYKYSRSLTQANFTWDEKQMAEWVCNSNDAIKTLTGDNQARTRMSPQHRCGQDGKDIAAYLASLKPQPDQLALVKN
ncbi:MAG: cytochrome C [Mariprofundus sp.]